MSRTILDAHSGLSLKCRTTSLFKLSTHLQRDFRSKCSSAGGEHQERGEDLHLSAGSALETCSWAEAEPPRGYHYTLLDVRDAVEACSRTRSQDERDQCFLNFGLKAAKVDKYYETVLKLEDAVQDHSADDDALAQRMVSLAGWFLFLMVGCKVF